MTVGDMMHVEGVGAAAVDPTGRWLLYERIRPYDQLKDYTFRTYATNKTGHQLWRYDTKKGGVPQLLPRLDPVPSSYMQGFSASGRFLAVIQYRFGALKLGAYDMVRDTAVMFPGTPAFSRSGEQTPTWISDNEIVFSSLPNGDLPMATSVRARTGQVLTKAWQEAWHGNVVTASEVRNSLADESDLSEPGRLIQANASTGKTRVLAEGLYTDLRVSPDKRFLAALAVSKPRPTDPAKLSEDDPRRYRLTIFDLATGRSRRLASALEFFPYTIAWSPDDTKLAAYGWIPNGSPRSGRFYAIDVATGAVTRYDHRGLDLASERERGWAQRPERIAFLGDRLAVFARAIPPGEDQSPRFIYKEVHPEGLSKPDWYSLAADGTSINLTAGLAGVSGVPVQAEKGSLTVVADDGVYRLYSDGSRHRLTPSLPGTFHFEPQTAFTATGTVARPEFADEAMFSVRDKGHVKIVMVDLRSGHEGATALADAPSDDATPLAGSLSAGAMLFRSEDGPVSRLLLARTADSGPPREIARINSPLAGKRLGPWRTVSYELKDQQGKLPPLTVQSCVLLPPDFSTGDPPPSLVVEAYPGITTSCTDQRRIDYPDWSSPYLWAARGYAYVRLTTPTYFIRTKEGPIAGMPAVIDAGINALVAQKLADPNHLVLFGWSEGGAASLFTAAYLHRFKAVISMNGWSDFFSDYFGPNGIYSSVYGQFFGDFARYDQIAGSDFGIGHTPFEDPQIYYRNSPVFLAPKIDAPVMLVHSDMDGFSMYQFDEMYGALVRAGKNVRYVRYWGEGHGPSSPANIADLWQRIDKFLAEVGVAPTTEHNRADHKPGTRSATLPHRQPSPSAERVSIQERSASF